MRTVDPLDVAMVAALVRAGEFQVADVVEATKDEATRPCAELVLAELLDGAPAPMARTITRRRVP